MKAPSYQQLTNWCDLHGVALTREAGGVRAVAYDRNQQIQRSCLRHSCMRCHCGSAAHRKAFCGLPAQLEMNSRVPKNLITHSAESCKGKFCCIHNPSPHHMVDWPMNWRADIQTMERICPCGVGHPDPDDLAYKRSIGAYAEGVHGCCGCCQPPSKT